MIKSDYLSYGISTSEHLISTSERLISCSEHLISCSERLISCSERLICTSERLISCKKHLISCPEQHITPSEGYIACLNESSKSFLSRKSWFRQTSVAAVLFSKPPFFQSDYCNYLSYHL